MKKSASAHLLAKDSAEWLTLSGELAPWLVCDGGHCTASSGPTPATSSTATLKLGKTQWARGRSDESTTTSITSREPAGV